VQRLQAEVQHAHARFMRVHVVPLGTYRAYPSIRPVATPADR
jgi:hypothetical protein